MIPPGLAWELLVVDNNSADSTRGAVEAFVAATRMRVRYLFEPRQGLSHARNTGIAGARGAIVAFTDDDVRPAPDWVGAVAAAFRGSDTDILGGRILPDWQHPPPPWLAARPFLRGPLAILEHPHPRRVLEARGVPNVWGANMAFRREVFERVGLFDPRWGVSGKKLYRGEEAELLRRALAAGFRAFYDPGVAVRHRIPAARMRRRYICRLYFDRAEGFVLSQPTPAGRGLLGAPLYAYRGVARHLGGWAWAAVRRRPDAFDHWLDACDIGGRVWGWWKRYLGVSAARTRATAGGRAASRE